MRRRGALPAAALVLALGACTSPEATRMRGGGPGADPGNRPEVVRMHEGSGLYHATPRLISPYGLDDVESTRGAARSGRGDGASARPR